METNSTSRKYLDDFNVETNLKSHFSNGNHLKTPHSILTPPGLHFRRGRVTSPEISVENYALRIVGEVKREKIITFEELRSMPSETIRVTLECAGNNRKNFEEPTKSGELWDRGAASAFEFQATRLYPILRNAGLGCAANEIVFNGADNGHKTDNGKTTNFGRSLNMAKVEEDVFIAYGMNGKPLPIEHGHPVRLVVPGWYAMASVKHLTTIQAIPDEFDGFYQKDRYVYKTPGNPAIPVTTMRVKSTIASIHDGEQIKKGIKLLRGFAWSGKGDITKVEISMDGGRKWDEAKVLISHDKYMWRTFCLPVDFPKEGDYKVMSRAHDSKGNIQPFKAEWNEFGYENNSIQVVNLRVR